MLLTVACTAAVLYFLQKVERNNIISSLDLDVAGVK